jgi:hypothetical protein
MRNACTILVANPEEKRPLGRPWLRWDDNIKMYLRVIEFGIVDWIHLAKFRGRWGTLVNMTINLRVP